MKNLFELSKKAVAAMATLALLTGGICSFAQEQFGETVSSTWDHVFVIKNDASLWKWNSEGAQQIMGNVRSVEGMYAISWDGSLWVLDDEPTKIMDNVNSISAIVTPADTNEIVAVLDTDGVLHSYTHRNSFRTESNLLRLTDDVRHISSGGDYIAFIKNDNSLWLYHYGEPEYIISKLMDDASHVHSGVGRFDIIKSDLSLWEINVWESTDGFLPQKITDDCLQIMDVGTVIKSDGALWKWGFDYDDEYNITGVKTSKVTDDVIYAWGDYNSGIVVKSDGTAWEWTFDQPELRQTGEGLSYIVPGYIGHMLYIDDKDGDEYADSLWAYGRTIPGYEPNDEAPYNIKIMDDVARPGNAIVGGVSAADDLVAVPTSSTVLVDGNATLFEAYNIGGNNYFKLRDLAYAINGTGKQFEVSWDGENDAISLTRGIVYTPVGGEMSIANSGEKNAVATSSKVLVDGESVPFAAYNIDGNNFFKLRDVGLVFNFNVTWDGTQNMIIINTSEDYSDN